MVGLQSPMSFADLLEVSHDPSTLPVELDSDRTETTTMATLATTVRDDLTVPETDTESGEEEEDEQEISLSITMPSRTTKNLLQVSDIDSSCLNNTLDSFCINLKNSVQEQFASSRERLFRQTENEISSITKVYHDALEAKDTELSTLRREHQALQEQHNELNVRMSKLQGSCAETKKKLDCVRQLSQTVMKWKNDCDKKRFVAHYVTHKVIPHKRRVLLQNIYYFWKNKALTQHHAQYDEMWQKRLETVSTKIIAQYEKSIGAMRDELNAKNLELKQLHDERNQQQQNMKRAFMRGVSALNLEAMALFDSKSQGNE